MASPTSGPSTVKVVLLDIEGTVCPISFVKDVLFPYCLNALPAVLEDKWNDPAFTQYREAFPPEHASSKEALEKHVRDLVARDVKASYLKSLQGYLWKEGYASGEIKAPLFPDVPTKLATWHGKQLHVMIYSSGSVPAQKLLFRYTNNVGDLGQDLTSLISGWFDTVNAGLKTEAKSYETILNLKKGELGDDITPAQWLFLSDNVREVDAAIEAGMQSFVVQRPGNADLPAEAVHRLTVIETLDALDDDANLLSGQKRSRSDGEQEESTTAPAEGQEIKQSQQSNEVATSEQPEEPETKKPRPAELETAEQEQSTPPTGAAPGDDEQQNDPKAGGNEKE